MSLVQLFPPKTLNETLNIVKDLNKHHIAVSLSYLPVVKNIDTEIKKEVSEYVKAFKFIKKNKLNSDVTIKLHQFGVLANYDLMKKNVELLVKEAKKYNVFVWIDVVMTETVDDTIKLYKELHKNHKNIGITFQAYLKRTENDLKTIMTEKPIIRLVKGFFNGNEFNSWNEVTKNYEKLMYYILKNAKIACIATHDEKLIKKAKLFILKNKIKNYEFHMFRAAKDDLAIELAKKYKVRIYIPYGSYIKYFIDGIFTFDNYRNIQRLLKFKVIR